MNSTLTVKRGLWLLPISAAVCGAAVFLYLTWLKFHYPYMLNLGEPALSQSVRSMSEGVLPYRRDFSSPPFTLVPYGPVYLILAGLLDRVFPDPFTAGRLVAAAATLGSAVLIYGILRADRVRKIFAALAALFFLTMPYVCRWGVLVNVDMTGVFLDLAAFYCWWRSQDAEKLSRGWFAAGIFLSVAAFFTKSSMIAAPAAFFWCLIFQKKLKAAFGLFLIEAACAAAVLTLLNRATHGGYFFNTVYEISKRQFFPVFIFRFWRGFLLEMPAAAVACAAGLVCALKGKKKLLAGLYVFFSALLTFSLGKQGSDTNYFLSLCAAAAVALGVSLDVFFGGPETAKKPAAFAAKGAVCLLLLIQLVVWIYPNADFSAQKKGYDSARDFFDRISSFIKKAPGDILSEDLSLLVANGKKVYYEPFPMGQMSYSGVWDPKPILDDLDRQHFSMAILYFYAPALKRSRTFTPEFMDTFNRRYRFVGRAVPPAEAKNLTTDALFLYAPRKERL